MTMQRTTVGQLLIDQALPEDLRRPGRVLDKKGITELLQEVAEKYPEKYPEIAKNLATIGHKVATATGGYSFGLEHLKTAVAARVARDKIEKGLAKIYADKSLTTKQRGDAVVNLVNSHRAGLVDAVYQEALHAKNPLALQVASGARGNPSQLNSLIGQDLLYVDHRGQPVPVPVLHNYSEGLTPFEYFAGAFGTRKGVIDLKSATSDAGFLSKQLGQVVHRLVVSGKDSDTPYDESNPRGLPVDVDDADNVGAALAHPVAGFPRNTIITAKMLKALKAAGHKTILVRSPLVGGPADGGVYSQDAGVREKQVVAPVGDYVGPAASQALSEPITQSQISSKHSGGVAGGSAGAVAGFPAINQAVQIPETLRGGATHAQLDGEVEQVFPAPQGGTYVRINGQDHHVRHGVNVTVKRGDRIEAGDPISEGAWHPAEIVKHKGIGEGRRSFLGLFRKILKDSSVNANRRNVELLARGLINHVRLTEEVGSYVPDDVLPYQTLEATWEPREGHVVVPPKKAMGKYLERPVLHYTIGTKIRPSVVKTLAEHKVASVTAHDRPPPFEPEMIRAMASIGQDPDWMTRMQGSYQQSSLLRAVHRGDVSDEAGTSFVPALARRENFGTLGPTKGWNPADVFDDLK